MTLPVIRKIFEICSVRDILERIALLRFISMPAYRAYVSVRTISSFVSGHKRIASGFKNGFDYANKREQRQFTGPCYASGLL